MGFLGSKGRRFSALLLDMPDSVGGAIRIGSAIR